MKPRIVASRAFILIILLVPLSHALSQAQDDDLILMKNLYLVITSQQPVTERSFAIIMNPGIALDPWFDPRNSKDKLQMFRILDEAFQPVWIYAPSGKSISKTYTDVLGAAEWASIPLNPQQRKDLQDVNHLLFADATSQTPSPDYQRYLDLKAAYDALQKQFDTASPDERNKLRPQLDEAKEDLRLQGKERIFVAALGKLRSLHFVKPKEWRDQMLKRIAAAETVEDGQQVLPVNFSPSYAALFSSPSWTEMTISGADLLNDPSNGTYIGTITPQLRMLRWSNGAIPSSKDEWGAVVTDSKNLTISFEYTVASLDRYWLDSALFQSRVWRYPTDKLNSQISDGANPLTGRAPNGRMPLLSIQVILARNIRIDGLFSEESLARFREHVRAGKATSWGPFALSGKYFQDTNARFFSARPYRSGVRCDEVQIIGWITQVIPRSPNPEPSFVWERQDNPR
jgi:hypothetical protein